MGIIKEQYEKSGSEFLGSFLIGTIEWIIKSEVRNDKEKVEEIEKLLEEYIEITNLQDRDYNL